VIRLQGQGGGALSIVLRCPGFFFLFFGSHAQSDQSETQLRPGARRNSRGPGPSAPRAVHTSGASAPRAKPARGLRGRPPVGGPRATARPGPARLAIGSAGGNGLGPEKERAAGRPRGDAGRPGRAGFDRGRRPGRPGQGTSPFRAGQARGCARERQTAGGGGVKAVARWTTDTGSAPAVSSTAEPEKTKAGRGKEERRQAGPVDKRMAGTQADGPRPAAEQGSRAKAQHQAGRARRRVHGRLGWFFARRGLGPAQAWRRASAWPVKPGTASDWPPAGLARARFLARFRAAGGAQRGRPRYRPCSLMVCGRGESTVRGWTRKQPKRRRNQIAARIATESLSGHLCALPVEGDGGGKPDGPAHRWSSRPLRPPRRQGPDGPRAVPAGLPMEPM